jgi:hypothetical protein
LFQAELFSLKLKDAVPAVAEVEAGQAQYLSLQIRLPAVAEAEVHADAVYDSLSRLARQ